MDKEEKKPDIVILGSGPAGLSAAIYASRAKLDVVILEEKLVGGQLTEIHEIQNYPGFESVPGNELADAMIQQVMNNGTSIKKFVKINEIKLSNEEKKIETKDVVYRPKAVIISTGASPKRIPISSESKYYGKGIHYCAACDGPLYADGIIGIVGGGNSAVEEAIFLAGLASEVIMIRRHGYFHAEQSMMEEMLSNPKITIKYKWDLVDVSGDEFLERAVIRNQENGEEKELKLDALFGYIGTSPRTELFKDLLPLSESGYIITDSMMQTNVSGVYAAGDVRDKQFRQITTAVSDGTIAALAAEKYINKIRGRKKNEDI